MIWATCRDPGGTNGLLPVVRELRCDGHEVALIASGKAVDLLESRGENFITANSVGDFLDSRNLPDVLITSMCEGVLGRDLIPLLRDTCPTIALQDFWGAWLFVDWQDLIHRPDYICVNDTIDAKIIHNAWPGFPDNRIIITGYPAFDKYKDLDVDDCENKVRFSLGLDQDKPIVLFTGQLWPTADALYETVKVLNELNKDIYFIPRFHPRMKNETPGELSECLKFLDGFRGGTLIPDSYCCDIQSILASADIVLSMFSTTLIEAAILRKPNVSILYPDTGMKQFIEETGDEINEFPLVTMGCSVKATNREELKQMIDNGLSGHLNLREAQERNFRLDGRNAARISELINKILN